MPNDAKMGMIVGVGLVIAIAVVFFRKDGLTTEAAGPAGPISAVHSTSPVTASTLRQGRAARARTAIRSEAPQVVAQRHTVTEGDTLFSLAKRYYRDERKFVEIFKVNQDVLTSPESLTPGTVLVIPKVGDEWPTAAE